MVDACVVDFTNLRILRTLCTYYDLRTYLLIHFSFFTFLKNILESSCIYWFIHRDNMQIPIVNHKLSYHKFEIYKKFILICTVVHCYVDLFKAYAYENIKLIILFKLSKASNNFIFPLPLWLYFITTICGSFKTAFDFSLIKNYLPPIADDFSS